MWGWPSFRPSTSASPSHFTQSARDKRPHPARNPESIKKYTKHYRAGHNRPTMQNITPPEVVAYGKRLDRPAHMRLRLRLEGSAGWSRSEATRTTSRSHSSNSSLPTATFHWMPVNMTTSSAFISPCDGTPPTLA